MIAVAVIVVLLVALFILAGHLVAREARADEVTAGKRRLIAEIARREQPSCPNHCYDGYLADDSFCNHQPRRR